MGCFVFFWSVDGRSVVFFGGEGLVYIWENIYECVGEKLVLFYFNFECFLDK